MGRTGRLPREAYRWTLLSAFFGILSCATVFIPSGYALWTLQQQAEGSDRVTLAGDAEVSSLLTLKQSSSECTITPNGIENPNYNYLCNTLFYTYVFTFNAARAKTDSLDTNGTFSFYSELSATAPSGFDSPIQKDVASLQLTSSEGTLTPENPSFSSGLLREDFTLSSLTSGSVDLTFFYTLRFSDDPGEASSGLSSYSGNRSGFYSAVVKSPDSFTLHFSGGLTR